MLVFTVIKGGGSGASEVDLFLESLFDFAAAYSEAFWQALHGGGRVPFVDIMRLIDMKQDAGCPGQQSVLMPRAWKMLRAFEVLVGS